MTSPDSVFHMDERVLHARLQQMFPLPFSSLTVGATAAVRVATGLPASERIAGTDVDQMFECVRRTLMHPTSIASWIDQWGRGRHLELERVVDDWTITVHIFVDVEHRVCIESVKTTVADDE